MEDRADSLGDNAIGSPLDSAAAGGTTTGPLSIWRRATAAAAHMAGVDAGESPSGEPDGDVGTGLSPVAAMASREASDGRCRPVWTSVGPPSRAPDDATLGAVATLAAVAEGRAADRVPRGPVPAGAADFSVLDPDPVGPVESLVSAKATGIEAIAEPIPKATASAPTRPTQRPEDIEPATALLMLIATARRA